MTKNKKGTKRALLMSALSLLMCVSMLIGSTFAWFTDSVTTLGNTIQSGTLDVDLVDAEGKTLEGKVLEFVDQDDNDLWEPGCTYTLAPVYVTNKGNLALKYEIVINGIDGDAKLLEAIEWTVTVDGVKTELADLEGKLLAGETTKAIVLSGHMKEEAGNEYQGLKVEGISIAVFATQYTSESDSFGNQYDAGAKYPFDLWDGKTVETPVADADGVYRISTAAQLVGMMNDSKYPNCNKYQNVVLENNIDLAGRTVSGFGDASGFFDGIFDGQGYTISNFKIDATDRTYYAGLFNQVSQYSGENTVIKNLTVSNATIKGSGQVGAIVGGMNGNTVVDNCKVINCTLNGVKKVGAVVGYTAGGTVTNNYAENCTVIYSEKEGEEILGYENTGSTVNNNSANNVVVMRSVSTIAELKEAAKDGGVIDAMGANFGDFYYSAVFADGTVLKNAKFTYFYGGNVNGTVVFENCEFVSDHSYSANFDSGNGNIIFNNCLFDGWSSFGDAITGVEMNNCTFQKTYNYGMVRFYQDATLNNCTFADNFEGVDTNKTGTVVKLNNCTGVEGKIFNNGSKVGVWIVDGTDISSSVTSW